MKYEKMKTVVKSIELREKNDELEGCMSSHFSIFSRSKDEKRATGEEKEGFL